MKLTKIFTAIAICFPLIAFTQNEYDIQHIRDIYYSVKEDIAFSKEHKFEGRLYCDIAEKNAHRKSWRATGVFHSKTEYWYNDDPSIINGVGENPRTCLDMVIENMEIAARQLYIEYLFEKGQLIFVFHKTDDVEVRLYFKDNRLIKQLGKFENDVPTTKEIMANAEICMQQFLYSFGVKEAEANTISNKLPIESQQIIVLDKPPFQPTFAQHSTSPQYITLQAYSATQNDITDTENWFANNNLSMPRMKTEVNFYYSGAEAPLKLPNNIPQQWGEYKLIEGIKGANANFYLYGESHINYQYMLITDIGNTRILHLLDFENYIYSDNNNKGDFIDMRVQWVEIIDNVLYVSTGHSTYAESSQGVNAFITAIDLSNYNILWQSDALVSNARNFTIIGDNIVCGYGFTAEPDFLYVLDRFTGKKVQTLKLASGPDYIIKKGNRLYVRTYNKDYVFDIEND